MIMHSKETGSLAFAGLRARSGPMSWPQHAIWSVLEWEAANAPERNMLHVGSLPEPVTQEQVCAAVLRLLETHETLRTTYETNGGWPTQTVHGSGAVPIHRYYTTADDGPATVEAAIRELSRTFFDLGKNMPLTVGIVVADGVPTTVIMVFSHVAVDAWSTTIIDRLFPALVRDGDEALRRYEGQIQQPIERAEFEQSPAGRALAARSTEFWLQAFRQIPTVMFAGGPEAGAQIERAVMLSPALARALAQITVRDRISTSAVLAGAVALVLSAALDVSDVALRTLVATRFDRASRYSVAALNLNGLFRIGTQPGPIRAHLERARVASLLAAKHSQCSPLDLERKLEQVMRERGVPIKQYMFFNDMSAQADLPGAAGAPSGHDVAGSGDTRFEVIRDAKPDKDSKFMLHVRRVSDVAELLVYQDRRFVPLGAVGILRSVEQVVLAAADDPETDTVDVANRAVSAEHLRQ
jgi:hypothetical protein